MTQATGIPKDQAGDHFINATVALGDMAGSLAGELVRLAAVELDRGNVAEAEDYLQQGMARDPENHHCRAYLAICMATREPGSRRAERAAREVLTAHPDDPVACYALGQILLLRSRRREAFRLFARARQHASGRPNLRRQLQRSEPRRQAVFPSLHRNHPLNVFCGRVRAFFSQKSRR